MKLIEWWKSRDKREQTVLLTGGLITSILLGYSLAWSPLTARIQELRNQVDNTQQMLTWLQESELKIRQLGGIQQLHMAAKETMLVQIEHNLAAYSTLKQHATIKQLSQQHISIAFDQANFDPLITWFRQLDLAVNFTIDSFQVTALDKPGLVKAELTLTQAGK